MKAKPSPSGACERCLPLYGHVFSDVAVLVANLFMFGLGVETCLRSVGAAERCPFPLLPFISVQLGLIAVLQLLVPLLLLATRCIFSPTIAFTLFLLQWCWIALGWVWLLSPSECMTTAPVSDIILLFKYIL